MSDFYTAERIDKYHHRIVPLRRGRSRRTEVIGFDTEASNGRPFLLQFSRHGGMDDTELFTIADNPREWNTPLLRFLEYVQAVATRKDTEYVFVGWNLGYEFTQLFGGLPPDVRSDKDWLLDCPLPNGSATYRLRVFADQRHYFTAENVATRRRIKVIDGMAYFVTSLNKAADMLGLGAKLAICGIEHPYNKTCEACKKRIRNLSRDDLNDPVFLKYAQQDAYLTRMVGELIVEMHDDNDVSTSYTAPSFATKVFKRHFLNGEIALPNPDLEQAGLYAYHGGKNGFYLGQPSSLAKMYAYDITSAYPEAMRQLPNVVTSQWHYVETYMPGMHALWRVSGEYKSCMYRGIMQHGNAWHETGTITDTWLTSYELDEAVSQGEIEITKCVGWVMQGDPGGPLAEYVDKYFAMKRTATGALRAAAKLFLNSLYGKFFQKIPLGTIGMYDLTDIDARPERIMTDPSQAFDWRAGGLYHPPIAALITGFVRAKIHRLEHRYDAVMTSTDGFFARKPPRPEDIGDDLGKLTVERGHLLIWRERLYIFQPSKVGGKPKFALHGFRGDVDALRAIPLRMGRYTYRATQMVTCKLSTRRLQGTQYEPGTFAELTYTLALGP